MFSSIFIGIEFCDFGC